MDKKVMALVMDGRVWEVRTATLDKPFHPALPPLEFPPAPKAMNWLDVTTLDPTPEVGWTEAGGIFSPPPQPPEPTLGQAKSLKRQRLSDDINRFIATKPNGGNRYDPTWLLSALDLRAEYREDLAVGGLIPEEETALKDRLAPLKQVQDWIKAVRRYYFIKAKKIRDLTTAEEVRAVTWDLSRFEFGATGPGAYPDPNVNMEQVTPPQ